ncbi:tRNA lysidine(34) synthetase TilS [Panacibacter ginsenosidivorans]|uniref:tRNA(Ile)-lysidine synthase n=1 Tax=Panacibacter ginsenosidivorans TaxID=1813871 RepID=A0A5B8V6U2_9BACT|nr:tRNA lysidine(34) synthetase TilS [Panacibacter ginsenosidivorans]QEC66939.1 tRNA lysidine(34) synthetase TilS [Panacibacter ginsenosidivorans]
MLLQQFQQRLKDHFQLQQQRHKFLLAVSGGIDSIVLTDLIYKSGFDFTIAHCNFQLRGEESERDEAFVRSLEAKYNKAVLVEKFDTKNYAAQNKLAIQEAARNLRYQWFEEIVNRESSIVNNSRNFTHDSRFTTHLATAHNANDNIETMLMHFFRGTGIHGLTGIPETDVARKIIRPLLFTKREDILAYAKENDLQWVEDSSNASDKYTRNFFRLQLLPAIKEIFPKAEANLLTNLERFKEADQLYKQAVDLHKKKLIEQKGNELHIPFLKLKKVNPLNTILWEIIKDFGFSATQLPEIKKLFNADNGSFVMSTTHRIIKNRNWLIIAPLQTETAANILINANDRKIGFENGIIMLQESSDFVSRISDASTSALLDAATIKFPLLLRRWKQGDYFYPLGMQKKKKLSKFFIDQKLSKTEKEKVWVLEADKKIIWIIGYRIDNRVKVTDKTKSVLHIEFKSK